MTRKCGRLTKRGTTCGQVLQPHEIACIAHATRTEQEQAYQLLKAQQETRR